MTPGRPRSDQVLLSFREASGKRRRRGPRPPMCRSSFEWTIAGMARLAPARPAMGARRSNYGANTMAWPADCFPRSRCQTYRRCSDLDRQERDPDM